MNKGNATLTRCPTCSNPPRASRMGADRFFVGCCRQSMQYASEEKSREEWDRWAKAKWDAKRPAEGEEEKETQANSLQV